MILSQKVQSVSTQLLRNPEPKNVNPKPYCDNHHDDDEDGDGDALTLSPKCYTLNAKLSA